MRIVLLGAPGAGKGTYASRLKDKYQILHVSIGDLLRESINKGEESGLKAKELMDKGELVPDETIINLLKERLAKDDAKNGILLDGFPRTIEQAEILDKLIGVDAVLNFDVSEQTVLDRLSARRICNDCGEIFNAVKLPPKQEGICDKCKGELLHRNDDKEETIRTRLNLYQGKSNPIINFYQEKGILNKIDSNIDIKDPKCTIMEDCEKVLNAIEGFN